LRNTVHGIIAVLFWVVFIRYWQIVMRQPMNSDTRVAIVTLAILAFLGALYLILWVLYNVRLSKKLRRRQVRLLEPKLPLRDYLGRWIVVDDPAHMRQAGSVEVEIKRIVTDGKTIEEKIFRTAPRGGGSVV
jgi:hypothetical protein